ncbi:1110_t:CDS:2, partial [Funneliformis geosporum]
MKDFSSSNNGTNEQPNKFKCIQPFVSNPKPSIIIKEQNFQYGICPDCKKSNIGEAWCGECDPGRFLREKNTTGNPIMDKLINELQHMAKHYHHNLEWISFDKFKDVKPIDEGGFAWIYSATWLDGSPKVLNEKKSRTGPITVVLKKIKDSNNISDILINEIKIHHKFQRHDALTQFYGISKDPLTEEFMLVLEFAKNGSLKDYVKNHYSDLKWEKKLKFLLGIAKNLEKIHELNYVHGDLHSGNVLIFNEESKITDLGLARSAFNKTNSKNISGVLPYIAPEILNKKPYTPASDIYSFGIIMTEISTGRPPFESVPHNIDLAIEISNGLRPKVAKGTPKHYVDIVNQCLDADPNNRPSATSLINIINKWQKDSSQEFINADKFRPRNLSVKTLHPQAYFTSRSILVDNSKNFLGVQIENAEVEDEFNFQNESNAFQAKPQDEIEARDQDNDKVHQNGSLKKLKKYIIDRKRVNKKHDSLDLSWISGIYLPSKENIFTRFFLQIILDIKMARKTKLSKEENNAIIKYMEMYKDRHN